MVRIGEIEMKKTRQTKLDEFGMKTNSIPLYKPKIFKAEDLNKPLNLGGSSKSFGGSKPLFDGKPIFKRPEPKIEEEEEEEPYWTAEQWEDWALKLYKDYPDARQYLPSWLIEAIEQK